MVPHLNTHVLHLRLLSLSELSHLVKFKVLHVAKSFDFVAHLAFDKLRLIGMVEDEDY